MQLVIITGASRGFGRSLSLSFARLNRSKDLHFVLSGRDVNELRIAETELLACRAAVPGGGKTRVDVVVADLADMEALPTATEQLLQFIPCTDTTAAAGDVIYESAVLVNNAGSLGDLVCMGSSSEPSGREKLLAIVTNINMNISSTFYITSEFIQRVVAARENNCGGSALAGSNFVVNVSSLCAVQPFDSWGLYCTGKAARNMLHAVAGSEQKEKGYIKTLNYAPGPMDTGMQKDIRENPNVPAATREYFTMLKATNQLVDIDKSSSKLVRLLLANGFATGSHVDFYDAVPELTAFACCSCNQCECIDCTCTKGQPLTINCDGCRVAAATGSS